MRIRHVEVFYHVYREGSISAAARNLHVSQPSVSKVLRHAEDQLGFALFDRRKGRLYPTAAAEELFAEVEDIYNRMSALNRTADNIRGRRGGHIRIGALPSLAFSIVPQLIASMRAENSDMTFDLATLHSEDIATALLEKRFDICIGFDADFDPRIRCQAINSKALFVLVKSGAFPEIENAGPEVAPELLEGREIIGLRDSGPVADRIETYLNAAGVEPHITVTAQTYYIAAELVKLGVAPAIVDAFTARRFADEEVLAFPLAGSPALPFAVMCLTEVQDHALIDTTITALQQKFG